MYATIKGHSHVVRKLLNENVDLEAIDIVSYMSVKLSHQHELILYDC